MANPQKSRRCGSLVHLVLAVAIVVWLVSAYQLIWRRGGRPLVVYCAHDSVYAEGILRDFEQRTGIAVSPTFDTEATKSLGLVELLVREKDQPRCDVFWNNELLGTMDLKEKGVLAPYKGPGFARIPDSFKDPEGYWTGFGARLRVYIVNTDKLEPSAAAVDRYLEGDLSRVAIAKPLYGTTLTHYSVLWRQWGGEGLKAWHRDWRSRNVNEVMGNSQVKDLVAQGVCDLGLTDTDDFFLAVDQGRPVEALPVRLEDDSVICIPNTVCIINGARRMKDAQLLVDYLLSEECEVALARSSSRQIPLGAVDERALPEEVLRLKRWAEDGTPLADLGAARSACLSWLKGEYLQ